MTWLELKNDYIKDHYNKILKQPERRIKALKDIEGILNKYYPSIINNPTSLKKYDRKIKKTANAVSF